MNLACGFQNSHDSLFGYHLITSIKNSSHHAICLWICYYQATMHHSLHVSYIKDKKQDIKCVWSQFISGVSPYLRM